jgi:hypothetical protein
LRKDWSECHPERSEGSDFRATVEEKADPSGKRRLRDEYLSVFPENCKPALIFLHSSRG